MKLAWKMILATVLIAAISVSVCAYAILNSTFQMELDAQFESAAQESQLFCLTLGSMTVQALSAPFFQPSVPEAVTEFLDGNPSPDLNFRVLDAGGALLGESGGSTDRLDWREAGKNEIQSQIFLEDGTYCMETLQRISVEGQTLYVYLFRDVTALFTVRQRNLRTSQLAVLGAIVCSTAVIVGISMVLTAPIKKLSRTTRQMAGGQYSRRAKVHSQDELGDLARDFNRMADALEEQISQLEDAARRQREFTASFAHELKTPLTSVIGYADTLRSRALPREQQIRAANYIFSEGKRLESMSFALMDLFSLEKEAPELRPVHAQQIAAAAAESSRYLLRQKKMQLQLDVEEAVFQGEPNLLLTLLYNLIDNARKASPDGSVIALLGRQNGTGYVFQLRDRGCGIPPEALSRLTEAFYMVDKSRARAEGGAGLGLALCERIAQVHGGHLKFESAVGQGTQVTVEIGGSV